MSECNVRFKYVLFHHHTIIRATFVCECVCSLSPPRSFDGSSPNLVAVCRWTSHLPLRGSFSKRSTGRWVNGSLSLSTILYMRKPHATQLQNATSALLLLLQSLIRRLLLHCISTVYVGGPRNCPWGVLFLKGQQVNGSTGRRVNGSNGSNLDGVCRWTSQLPLRGSFSKRSTGRRVNGSNGSTGQRLTFTFTILYMTAEDARLTPPRYKKHTAYDDTRLTSHHCKNHTASFARSTGKFPSKLQIDQARQAVTESKICWEVDKKLF